MDNAERDGHVESVIGLVEERDYVTFAEIQDHLAGRGIDVKGNKAICMPGDENAILWMGMSDEFVAIFHAMQGDQRILPRPASALAYLVDGHYLRLPIAKRLPKGGYREMHWIPVTFCKREGYKAKGKSPKRSGTKSVGTLER